MVDHFIDSDPDRLKHTDEMLDTDLGKKVRQYLQDEFDFKLYKYPLSFRDPQSQDKLWLDMIQDYVIDGRPFVKYYLSHESTLIPEVKLCFRAEELEKHLQGRPAPCSSEIECKPLGSLKSAIEDVFTEVRNTVNGRRDRTAKSYSKYLIIPLFKYPRPVLYVRKIRTNTLTLEFKVQVCEQRAKDLFYRHEVALPIDLPLKDINDLTAIDEIVTKALACDDRPLTKDGNKIDIVGIWGYAIDVSQLCRDDFGSLTGTSLGMHKSFRVDGEVVTDCAAPHYVVEASETLQFIRLLTLLAIGEDHDSFQKLMDAYRSGALEQWIPPDPQEQEAVERIYEHLEANWQEEGDAYDEVFEKGEASSRYPAFTIVWGGVRNLLKWGRLYGLIAKIRAKTELFKNEGLYQAMAEIIGKPILRED